MTEQDHTFNIITRNLDEVLGADKLNDCLSKNGTFSLYWGTAPTGRPHIAYFLPMTKIADFLKAGCDVTILFADLHAYLDNMKAPWELLEKRKEYYEILIKGMLKALNVPLNKLKFVRGTDYQLEENYTASVYQIIGITTARDAAKAGCDVVKQTSDPFISGIIYPLLQALDEEFLGVDAQFGGVDQRKIFTYAEKYLPNLGFAKRSHFMNPMIPGLTGGKMSASEENSKIDLLDPKEKVLSKLKTALCSGPTAKENGILAFIKFVILPIKEQLNIELLNKYNTIEEIEQDFACNIINEEMLKKILETALCSLMENLEYEFTLAGKPDLDSEAYPSTVTEINDTVISEMQTIDDFPIQLNSLIEAFPSVAQKPIEEFPQIIDTPSILWSCRSSGEPHIGYLVPLRKLASLSHKKWKVTVLIEDIGAHLYSQHCLNKPTWNLLKQRAELYKQFIKAAFIMFGGDLANFKIILGTEFQLSRDYALLLYQSFSRMTESECDTMLQSMINSSDIVANLSSVIYPCMAVLDQLYLKSTVRLFADYSFIDQYELFAHKLSAGLHLSNHKAVIVKHDIILSLDGKTAMGSPKIGAKNAPKDTISISMCDNVDSINRKMKKAFFDPQNLVTNPSIIMIEKLIWPSLQGRPFVVSRSEENGGDVQFSSIDDIHNQLINGNMYPGDIKTAVVYYLQSLFLHQMTSSIPQLNQLLSAAYPAEAKKIKPNKKSINPNKYDLRVATITHIIYQNGQYHMELQSGRELLSIIKKDHCYSWTPNDKCIIAIASSTYLVGVLCLSVSHSINHPQPLRLVDNFHMTNISFLDNESISPCLKESSHDNIIEMIQTHCVINNGHLQWGIKDGFLARDIEICVNGNNNKIVVH